MHIQYIYDIIPFTVSPSWYVVNKIIYVLYTLDRVPVHRKAQAHTHHTFPETLNVFSLSEETPLPQGEHANSMVFSAFQYFQLLK